VPQLGMARSMVPARVSQGRCRKPLRQFVRSLLRSAYPAPHTASTSACISTLTIPTQHVPERVGCLLDLLA
jgi:hypothetical protein